MLLSGFGPAGREQRLVGLRAFQPHTFEHRLGFRRPIRLQIGKTQREIGLVLQCQQLLAGGIQLADAVQHARCVIEPVLTHQGDAKIEVGIDGPSILGVELR